jgi:hypothetical protein
MTQEGLVQSQEESTELNIQPGPMDQVADAADEASPETEAKPSATYTQEQWDLREKEMTEARARYDRSTAQARQAMAEAAMQQQIIDAEHQAQAEDRQAVDDGEISESTARQRQRQRQNGLQQRIAEYQANVQQQAQHTAIAQQGESTARFLVAANLAKEHGVEVETLLNDKALNSGELMEIKAKELALTKRESALKGTERFDSGLGGSAPRPLDDMSPEEKISYGVAHPPKRGR